MQINTLKVSSSTWKPFDLNTLKSYLQYFPSKLFPHPPAPWTGKVNSEQIHIQIMANIGRIQVNWIPLCNCSAISFKLCEIIEFIYKNSQVC